MTPNRPRRGFALAAGRILRTRYVVTVAAATFSTMLFAEAPRPAQQSGLAAPAQKAAEGALPSARSILDRHVEAIGGRAAVLSHSSTTARGTLSIPKTGLTGMLEMYGAKPNKSLLKITLGGLGELTEAFDGTHGWSQTPMTGPMLLEGKQLEDRKFDSEFHSELREESRYASISTVERTEFDGRPCYKLRLVRKSGGEDFEFYDVATGLKAGSVTTRETNMGTVTGTAIEAGYRKFGNLLQPTTLKNVVAGVEQVITITAVEYDTVPSSIFVMPAEIKALIK